VAALTNSHPPDQANELKSVKLINRRWLSKKSFELELTRPPSFDFKAGQTVQFVHGEIKRYYSIVSSPDEQRLIFCVRNIEEGKFTPILAAAERGTRFKITGPHGYFIFRRSSRPPVFVATGTGIAPFASMSRSGVGGFILLHGVSNPDDLYYGSFFSETAFRYVPCLSMPVAADQKGPDMFQGKVTRYIRDVLKRAEYDFYLCGRSEMVRDVTLLVDDYFPNSLVYTEVFFD
jgi:ferredoxin-NADP reductase